MIDGKALGLQLRALVCALFGLTDPNPSTEAVSGQIVIVPDVRDKPPDSTKDGT